MLSEFEAVGVHVSHFLFGLVLVDEGHGEAENEGKAGEDHKDQVYRDADFGVELKEAIDICVGGHDDD